VLPDIEAGRLSISARLRFVSAAITAGVGDDGKCLAERS